MEIQGLLDSISIYTDLLLVLSDLIMCFALRIVTNNIQALGGLPTLLRFC